MSMFPDEEEKGYTSASEAIDREIIPALGDYVNDFDVSAIFDEVFSWNEKKQEWTQTVDGEEFWEIVRNHDIS